MDSKVKRIVVKLNEREVELSVEEAKLLSKELNELFGEKVIVKHEHDWHWRTPQYPYWGIGRYPWDRWVTCTSTDGSLGKHAIFDETRGAVYLNASST